MEYQTPSALADGDSISTYKQIRPFTRKIPPALAAWRFSFDLYTMGDIMQELVEAD
jgi:hypothetical protein